MAWMLANPVAGQESPESLLPEGFEDPVPAPPPAPPPPPSPTGPAPAGPAPPPPGQSASADEEEGDEGEEEDGEFGLDDLPPQYELPAGARRPLDYVGPLTEDEGGYGEQAFGGANGMYLAKLMRRMDAPLASRWGQIALRRALLSRVESPGGIAAPDWVADRAWLLLRMGEVDGARMLVQRVDTDRYTRWLYAVAMQTGLAMAEPSALCPLVGGARRVDETPAWVMAEAICAGLLGDSATATAQMTGARRRGITNGFDLLLGERGANAGGSSDAVEIDWDRVERLNAWRFGMATATGAEIPEALYGAAGRQVAAWRARSPHIALADRIEPARMAAALGVFSNQTLVSMYSALLPELEPAEVASTPTGLLRAAYVRPEAAERIAAMAQLWAGDSSTADGYAGLILTARAAAGIRPSPELAGSADRLVAAMMSAGFDISASRWARVVQAADESEVDEAWALLAVGAPREFVDIDLDRLGDYASRAGSSGRHRAQLLAAALAGLGRIDAGDVDGEFELGLGAENAWTRQLDRAARLGQPGTVALLAATGLQARSWAGIPPSHLYHIVSALRRAGLDPEARMIAAEALTRA
ncbi:MAG: hypothetical protein ABR601_02855 [Parasphingopyxis sp.]